MLIQGGSHKPPELVENKRKRQNYRGKKSDLEIRCKPFGRSCEDKGTPLWKIPDYGLHEDVKYLFREVIRENKADSDGGKRPQKPPSQFFEMLDKCHSYFFCHSAALISTQQAFFLIKYLCYNSIKKIAYTGRVITTIAGEVHQSCRWTTRFSILYSCLSSRSWVLLVTTTAFTLLLEGTSA